jgi:hypothetical protein
MAANTFTKGRGVGQGMLNNGATIGQKYSGWRGVTRRPEVAKEEYRPSMGNQARTGLLSQNGGNDVTWGRSAKGCQSGLENHRLL